MALQVFLVLLIFALTEVNSAVPHPIETQNKLNNLTCQIASHINEGFVFVYSQSAEEELLRCLSTTYIPILTIGSDNIQEARKHSSLHILTVSGEVHEKELAEISKTIGWMTKMKHLAKFILIFKVSCDGVLESVFKVFWKNNFLNVIALCNQSNSEQIYTYEPFTEHGFRVVKPRQTSELFYDKLRNLHHYKIRASQFYDPLRSIPISNSTDEFRGVDGLLGQAIIEHLNATMQIIVPPNDELYGTEVNGVLTGALKHVATGVTQINWNIRLVGPTGNRTIEAIYPIGKRIMLHLVVPKGGIVPQYLNFIRVFTPFAWWILLLNFILVTITFAAMQHVVITRAQCEENSRIRFLKILEIFFKTAIGDAVDGFHRISSLRQFLITWILFCYIISSIYFAKMQSVFIHPEYEKDIVSMSEFPRLDVPIYSIKGFVRTIKPVLSPEIFETLLSKHREFPTNYEAQLRSMTKGSNNRYAFILRRERANVLITRTYDSVAKRPRYHLVKEYLISSYQTYIVTQGSAFFEKFEQLIIWFFEHGLMKHWETISRAEVKSESQLSIDASEDDDYNDDEDDGDADKESYKKTAIVLTMDILQGAFYLWIIGIGAACLGFLIELGFWKWRQRGQPA